MCDFGDDDDDRWPGAHSLQYGGKCLQYKVIMGYTVNDHDTGEAFFFNSGSFLVVDTAQVFSPMWADMSISGKRAAVPRFVAQMLVLLG